MVVHGAKAHMQKDTQYLLICPILLVFTVTHATGISSGMCSSVPQPDYAGLPTAICMYIHLTKRPRPEILAESLVM